jgi:hypothetical protein
MLRTGSSLYMAVEAVMRKVTATSLVRTSDLFELHRVKLFQFKAVLTSCVCAGPTLKVQAYCIHLSLTCLLSKDKCVLAIIGEFGTICLVRR